MFGDFKCVIFEFFLAVCEYFLVNGFRIFVESVYRKIVSTRILCIFILEIFQFNFRIFIFVIVYNTLKIHINYTFLEKYCELLSII